MRESTSNVIRAFRRWWVLVQHTFCSISNTICITLCPVVSSLLHPRVLAVLSFSKRFGCFGRPYLKRTVVIRSSKVSTLSTHRKTSTQNVAGGPSKSSERDSGAARKGRNKPFGSLFIAWQGASTVVGPMSNLDSDTVDMTPATAVLDPLPPVPENQPFL